MEKKTCDLCLDRKATLSCGICHCALCKACMQFSDAAHFSFLPEIPEELTLGSYCRLCFDDKIAPAIDSYNEIMTRAKNVNVYDKSQGKETRLLKRTQEIYSVENCADREEAILRLAFFAAQANYNAIIDVEVAWVKVREGGSYVRHMWNGRARPAQVKTRNS